LVKILAELFIGIGCFFIITGVIGILRFPDVFSRIHPAGKAGTAGIFSIFIGLILHTGFSFISGRLFLIALFMLITNPVAAHAIARGAFESGIEPWVKKGND
jgi:multicomponent Na+:H+ antiporter subunit G